MRIRLPLIAILTGFLLTQPLSALEMAEMVERINQRYDDFYRWHREQEERMERLMEGRGDPKKFQAAREQVHEKARQEYVRSRKAKASDEHLQLEWERLQKQQAQEHEMLRRRYVSRRDAIEEYRLKGRQIPPMKEYNLEDY